MSAPDFLDTNVIVYAYDAGEPKKQRIARELILRGPAGQVVTSTQVLAEFAATLLHKLSPPATVNELSTILDALSPLNAVATDEEMVHRAVQATGLYKIHFYDGLIIAAAEQCGSTRIWSEDLNAGQKYFDISVENPFA